MFKTLLGISAYNFSFWLYQMFQFRLARSFINLPFCVFQSLIQFESCLCHTRHRFINLINSILSNLCAYQHTVFRKMMLNLRTFFFVVQSRIVDRCNPGNCYFDGIKGYAFLKLTVS